MDIDKYVMKNTNKYIKLEHMLSPLKISYSPIPHNYPKKLQNFSFCW